LFYSAPGQANPKVSLLLPSNADYKVEDLPNEYDLIMTPSKNEEGDAKRAGFVLSEKKVEGGRGQSQSTSFR
jgi:hypothetical protein